MEGIESYGIDYEKPATLQPALKGIRKVFLVLPIAFDGEAMANAGRLMVEAALHSGVQHIVKLSAFGAGDEGYAHARWHRRVERIVEHSGLDWTVETRAGGTCVVRVVHRWFGATDDWDAKFDAHAYGWASSRYASNPGGGPS